jgi:hypothetical protein
MLRKLWPPNPLQPDSSTFPTGSGVDGEADSIVYKTITEYISDTLELVSVVNFIIINTLLLLILSEMVQ